MAETGSTTGVMIEFKRAEEENERDWREETFVSEDGRNRVGEMMSIMGISKNWRRWGTREQGMVP